MTNRVGEEDNPVVANELVEVDGTVGGLSIEVGGNGAQTETAQKPVSLLLAASMPRRGVEDLRDTLFLSHCEVRWMCKVLKARKIGKVGGVSERAERLAMESRGWIDDEDETTGTRDERRRYKRSSLPPLVRSTAPRTPLHAAVACTLMLRCHHPLIPPAITQSLTARGRTAPIGPR